MTKRMLVWGGMAAFALGLWLARTSLAQQCKLSDADRKFLLEAASGGLMEVKLGKIAEEQATNPDVQKFGRRMVTDHTTANKELMQLAERKGLEIPKKMNDKDQDNIEMLSKLRGADFDAQYMKHMVADHVTDVSKFEDVAQNGQDPDIRAFANKTLPTLKDHLRLARQVADKLNK